MTRILSFCCGVGALDMTIKDGVHVAHSDISVNVNKFFAKVYPHSEELGDFTVLDSIDPWEPDVITAGLPCQPISQAGKQKFDQDERYLFDEFLALLNRSESRPVLLFENVSFFLNKKVSAMRERFISGLHQLNYNYSHRMTKVSDGGGPHQRARYFAAAWQPGTNDRVQFDSRYLRPFGSYGYHPKRQLLPTPVASDTHLRYFTTGWPPHVTIQSVLCPPSSDQTVFTVERLKTDFPHIYAMVNLSEQHGNRKGFIDHDKWGPFQKAIDLWVSLIGRNPPNRACIPTKHHFIANAGIPEWMMGFPAGYVTGNTETNRAALHMIGNSVCPQQAAHALEWCLHTREEGTLFS